MNETASEREQQATDDFNLKLKLEPPAARQFRGVLRNMASDLEDVFAATGTVIDAENYRDDFIGILRPLYRKTSFAFGNQLEDDINANINNDDHFPVAALALLASTGNRTLREQAALFRAFKGARMLDFINNSVPERATLITRTNQDELNRAVANATQDIVDSDAPVTRQAIGAKAAQNFRESSLFRGRLIAATEIQNAAEGSKRIEVQAFEDTIEPVSDRVTIEKFKEWHTRGDAEVRTAHRAADLQRRDFDEPFEVANESLNFPGDTSLGASAGNTINCRCSAIYLLEGEVVDIVTSS